MGREKGQGEAERAEERGERSGERKDEEERQTTSCMRCNREFDRLGDPGARGAARTTAVGNLKTRWAMARRGRKQRVGVCAQGC